MANLEEFGSYLLLKKLGEDSLGETFRAGSVGSEGVQQVVLLRVFNGRNVNGSRLWEKVAGRRNVQEQLKGPNIGDGIDLGEVRGIPYAAYDYISGKSLTQLLVQASKENEPIPLDHALLITERVAAALATAWEMRVGGQKLVHGFVVPHMVMVSNEGESRLLGFEVAPGLVDLAGGGAFGTEVTRYIAPEAVSKGVVDKADDGFSLGVLLYELATCRPLPEPGGDGYRPILESAQLPGDGGPLPAPIGELIGRSLGPRGERPADPVAWHRALAKVMSDGGYDATAFNLAFFMHNLFRSDIEAETKEIAVEKTLEIPAETMAALRSEKGTAASAEPAAAETAEVETVSGSHPVAGYTPPPARSAAEPPGAAEKKGKGGLWIGVAAAVLLLAGLGGAGWWWMNRSAPEETETAALTTPPPPEIPVTPADETGLEGDDVLGEEELPPEPEGPSPEEIQAQIAEMIDSRSQQMEARFQEQYDERIKALQAELEQAQEEAEAHEQAQAEREKQAAEEAAEAETEEVEPATTAPPAESAGEEGAREGTGGAAIPQAGDRLASGDAVAAPTTTPGGSDAAAAGGRTAPPPAAPEPPPEPAVRLGDLVSFGPGVTPPDLVSMPDPRYPPMARRLGKEAIVEVRLLVDETGNVTRSETVGKKQGYGFEDAALDAARRARYRPATKDGVRVKMWTSVKLRFENP